MANYNLTNQAISDTFEQLLQKNDDTGKLVNGTGSVVQDLEVTGSLTASFFVGDGSNLTNISTEWDNITNKPSGIVSGSSQIDLSQASGIAVSSSYAITSSHALNGGVTSIIAGNNITIDQSQGDVTINATSTASVDWDNIVSKPTGLVSGSSQISYPDISNIPAGIVSSSVQVSDITGSSLVTASNDFSEITFTKGDGSTFLVDSTPRRVVETVKNKNGFMAKGTPVYVSGSTGNELHVYQADAGDATRVPATFILDQDLDPEESGIGILSGFINGVDTSAFAEGVNIYLAVGGGYTDVQPTGSAFVQKLGNVIKSDLNGSGVISGAGRVNALPNLTSGYAWVGDVNGVPQSVSTASWDAHSDLTSLNSFTASQENLNSTFATTGSNAFVGNQEITGSLTVQSQIQTTGTNAVATLSSGNNQNTLQLSQTAFGSDLTVQQNNGDGGQYMQLNKGGVGQIVLNLNGTTGQGFVQAANGLTNGNSYLGSDYIQTAYQQGGVDRRVIIGGASSQIAGAGLSGDKPYIAIRSNTGIQEVINFQDPSTYTDGTVAFLAPISSSTSIEASTISGTILATNGVISGSDQLTSSYDSRYAVLTGTNNFNGTNIFAGTLQVSGSGQFINPIPGGFSFDRAIDYGTVTKNNVPYSYGLGFTGMLNYSGVSNRYDNALVSMQADSAAFNYYGIAYNSGYEMGDIMLTVSGSSATNRLETNGDGTTTYRAYGTDIQIGTQNNNSINIGNAGVTQGVTIGAATQVQLGGGNVLVSAPLQVQGGTTLSGSVQTEVATTTISGTTASIDFSDTSLFELTLADGVDTHIDAINIGTGQTVNVLINQSGTSAGTVSFSPKFFFPSGSSYTATTTTNAKDILTFITFGNTSNIYVSSVNNMI